MNRAVLIGLGVVGSLAIVAIALSLRPSRSPAAAPPVPQIHVVAAPNAPAPPRAPQAQPSDPAAAANPAAQASEPPTAGESAAAASKREPRVRRTASPDALSLTRAFRKQQPKLEACFAQHPAAMRQPTTQLEFDLDAGGKLTRVSLVPRTLAATPFGKCLIQVARATAFPTQGRAVSFAIPVSADRGGGG